MKIKLISLLLTLSYFLEKEVNCIRIKIEKLTSDDSVQQILNLKDIFDHTSSNIKKQINQKKQKPYKHYSALANRLSLNNQYGMSYFGNISLGETEEQMSALFDTGSSMIWFTQTGCEGCKNAKIKHSFNCTNSNTCEKSPTPYQIQYGKGFVKGHLYKDTFTISGAKAEGQIFLGVEEIKDLDNFPADGLIGLGSKALSDGYDTLMDSLYSQGKIQRQIFAFTLANYFKYESQSYLDIGEIDTRFYEENEMIRCGLVSEYYWGVQINRITFSDEDGSHVDLAQISPSGKLKSQVAIIDSGTSIITFPEQDFKLIIQVLNQKKFNCEENSKYGQIVCKGQLHAEYYPSLQFTLCGSTTFKLKGSQYVICDEEMCLIRLSKLEIGNFAILGDLFMQQYYTVFDFESAQIGFFPKHGYKADDVLSTSHLFLSIILTILINSLLLI